MRVALAGRQCRIPPHPETRDLCNDGRLCNLRQTRLPDRLKVTTLDSAPLPARARARQTGVRLAAILEVGTSRSPAATQYMCPPPPPTPIPNAVTALSPGVT